MNGRRAFLRGVAVVGASALAGCAGDGTGGTETETTPTATATSTASPTGTETGPKTVDVAAGPEGRLRFVPERVEISVGDAVRWTFESPGHNVTTKPGASEKIRLPEGAEPFASYEDDRHYAINEVGTTYEHAFTVPGEYVYVCAPHEDQGMVGTVIVSE